MSRTSSSARSARITAGCVPNPGPRYADTFPPRKPRFPPAQVGNRPVMRLMFWTYTLVIAGGLVAAFLVGLTHN